MAARAVVEGFWSAMQSNDFARASLCLSEGFAYFMPQTGEFLQGRTAFAGLNSAYPAKGPWRFEVRSIVADGTEAVSDVAITDGEMHARAVTFHSVKDGLITRQIEYWPDPYPAPEWRRDWVTLRPDYLSAGDGT